MDIGINIGTIAVALIVSVVAPSLLAHFGSRQRRSEKEQDYARDDELRAQAKADAKALLESNERIAAITLSAGKTTQNTLDIIHSLVNSKLTEEKQQRYESLVTLEASLNREAELLNVKDQPIPKDQEQLLASTRKNIVALGEELADRRRQQAVIDAQVRNLAEQLEQYSQRYRNSLQESVSAPAKVDAPVPDSHGPTVEAPVRVIVPGSGERANSTVEKK